MRMAIAVAMPASIDDHGVVQNGVPINIFHSIEPLQKESELLKIIPIDDGDFLHLFRILFMMGKIVVSFVDSYFWIRCIHPFMGQL